jgi:subtilase family protein
MLRYLCLHLITMLALGPLAQAQIKKPPLPAGRDPGGVAIALIATGIDYTAPEVAGGLARDGEGELIGHDVVDNDNRPFGDGTGDGTRLAIALIDKQVGARLVPVRVDPSNPASLARAVAFIAQTPARIAVVPLWGPREQDWQPFRQAAGHFAQILFVVAAGDEGRDLDKEPIYPAGLGLPNLLVVTAAGFDREGSSRVQIQAGANWGADTVDAAALAGDSALAAAVAARAAAAMLARSSGAGGAELKQRLIQSALQQREGETPQRTRTLALLAPIVLRGPLNKDPAERILDKARVPERLQELVRPQQRPPPPDKTR